MALTPEQIEEIFLDHGWHWNGKADAYIPAARAIEAEVRKDDEALIRQLLEALENSSDLVFKDTTKADARDLAITAGRARLEGNQ